MGMNIVKAGIGIALIVCGILTIADVKKMDKQNRKTMKMQAIAIFVEIAAGFCSLASLSPTVIKVMIPEQEKLYQENEKLEEENKELKQNIIDKDKKVTDQEAKLKTMRASMKNNAEFLDYKLYYNDDEIKVNNSIAIANINEKLFLSDDTISTILNSEVQKDDENKLVYIGKYPDSTVSLLTKCNVYDTDGYFKLGKEEAYKIRGNTYTSGFTLSVTGGYSHSVSFNLEGKYKELIYSIGHIDETNKDNIILTPYLDENPSENIVINSDVDPNEKRSIQLNNAKVLRLEWSGNPSDYGAKYGFVTLQLK